MNQRPRTIEEQVSLLRAIGMEFEDLSEAKALFESGFSSIPVHKIGISTNWKHEPLWK